MLAWTSENGEPQLDFLMLAQLMLYEAECLNWHHEPPGTIEGDHYSNLVRLVQSLERRHD